MQYGFKPSRLLKLFITEKQLAGPVVNGDEYNIILSIRLITFFLLCSCLDHILLAETKDYESTFQSERFITFR